MNRLKAFLLCKVFNALVPGGRLLRRCEIQSIEDAEFTFQEGGAL
jgi:hypothetical protein